VLLEIDTWTAGDPLRIALLYDAATATDADNMVTTLHRRKILFSRRLPDETKTHAVSLKIKLADLRSRSAAGRA
jgi:hypothetical protein